MLVNSDGNKFDLFRDIIAVYKSIVQEIAIEYGVPKEAVEVRSGDKERVNRSPLITVERGEMQHIPRSLMLGEEIVPDPATGRNVSATCHIIEYPIEFTCYGNSYLEAEKLGTICMDAILSAGMRGVQERHGNITGAELVWWGKSSLSEGSESSLYSCQVLGKAFVQMNGAFNLIN